MLLEYGTEADAIRTNLPVLCADAHEGEDMNDMTAQNMHMHAGAGVGAAGGGTHGDTVEVTDEEGWILALGHESRGLPVKLHTGPLDVLERRAR